MVPLVVKVEDLEGKSSEQLAFIKSPVRIGRGELNDVPLARPFVSTYHGLVQFDEKEARYVDLGSTNGSLLDGEALERNTPALLGPGAEIRIGSFRLTFARRTTAEQPVARRMTAFAVRATASGRAPPSAAEAPRAPEAACAVAAAAADTAIEAAAVDLDLHYASYRGAWDHLRSALEGAVAGLDGSARTAALSRLASRYAAVGAEPQFAALRGTPQPAAVPVPGEALRAPEAGDLGGEALRLLRTFAESYLPGDPRLASPAELEAVLGRVADALETFGRSYLELRSGYDEFGKEMGVRTVQAEGPVQRARDARQLLAYVLDPRAEGRGRELQRAFADFMIHQVALLRGVVEGAQALLGRVSPEAISAQAPQSLWPMRAAALWKTFEERFQELAGEENAVSDVLFGKEFARAYSALVGQRSAEEPKTGTEPPARRGPRR